MTTRTPPITFTEDNFCAVISGLKTETRRLSNGNDNPRYSIGDRCYLVEPTKIIKFESILEDRISAIHSWFKFETITHKITEKDLTKIKARKSGMHKETIARFMLKSFARYWVEIVDVQPEYLMDITDEGAIAEGIKFEEWYSRRYFDYMAEDYSYKSPIDSYVSEIEMLHGEAIAQSNPLVWVYKFKFVGIAA